MLPRVSCSLLAYSQHLLFAAQSSPCILSTFVACCSGLSLHTLYICCLLLRALLAYSLYLLLAAQGSSCYSLHLLLAAQSSPCILSTFVACCSGLSLHTLYIYCLLLRAFISHVVAEQELFSSSYDSFGWYCFFGSFDLPEGP